jgi:hypothetical protein
MRAACRAIDAGSTVEYFRGDSGGIAVETIVVDGHRAGQVTNGDAVWGEWSEDEKMVYLDGGTTDASGAHCELRVDLDGREELF